MYQRFTQTQFSPKAVAWQPFLFLGVLFLLFGIAILLNPALLVVMVASFFIFIGLSIVGFAFSMKRMSAGVTQSSKRTGHTTIIE